MCRLKLILLISALVLVLSRGVLSQICNDCMIFDSCPRALELARNQRTAETLQLFRNATCGVDRNTTLSRPMVCCSKFSTTNGSVEEPESPEDVRIAGHENLHLLPDDCGKVEGYRFSSRFAHLYEFPWMALVSHRSREGIRFGCAGSIINKRYILTAAHCVKNKIIEGVRVGEFDIENIFDCQEGLCERHIQDILVEKTIIHEEYRGLPAVLNDIALVRLADDIDFNHKNVHRICLPKTSKLRKLDLNNRIATVPGWGLNDDRTLSSVLRTFDIPIFNAEACSEFFNRFARPGDPDIPPGKLCAGSRNKDSCAGDSGGPLMIEEENGSRYSYIQYGIVSYGPMQCGSDFPAIYTDVTKYMGWILDNIEV